MVLYVRFHVWTLLIFCHSTYTSILSKKERCYIFAYTGAISQFLRYTVYLILLFSKGIVLYFFDIAQSR